MQENPEVRATDKEVNCYRIRNHRKLKKQSHTYLQEKVSNLDVTWFNNAYSVNMISAGGYIQSYEQVCRVVWDESPAVQDLSD